MSAMTIVIGLLAGMMATEPANGGTKSAESSPQSVLVDVRLIQINPSRRGDDSGESTADAGNEAHRPPQVVSLQILDADSPDPDDATTRIVSPDGKVRIDGHTFEVGAVVALQRRSNAPASESSADDGRGAREGGNSGSTDAAHAAKSDAGAEAASGAQLADYAEVLAAPRMLTLVGQSSSIRMGAEVPYLARNAGGCLEVRHDAEAQEGVEIEFVASDASDEFVTVKTFRVRVTAVASRQPIEGVPFDVGAPVMRTIEVSTSLKLASGKPAILALPRTNRWGPLLLAVVSASPYVAEK